MRELLKGNKVIAILRNVRDEFASEYAYILAQNGIRLIEVAMNTPNAANQIRSIKDRVGTLAYVGAGTVLNTGLADKAVEAGAEFILTPSVIPEILSFCKEHGIPHLPGVMTPSEVGVCVSYGYDVMNLFPAGELPMSYIKRLQGPFEGTDYVAVNGVTRNNAKSFLDAGFIAVGIGGGICERGALNSGDFDTVRKQVREFADALK